MSTASLCVDCGSALVPGAPFCGACGSRAIASAPTSIGSEPSGPVPVGEPAVRLDPVVRLDPTQLAEPPGAPEVPATAGRPQVEATAASGTAPAILPRVLALLVDQALAGLAGGVALLVVVLVVQPDLTAGASATADAALVAPSVVAGLVQVGQWLWEGRTGKSVGNLALHLRTVSAVTGRPAGVGRVLVRQLVQGLGAFVCFVGVYVVAASGAWDRSGERRGWHDKAAGTRVVPAPRLARARVDRVPAPARAVAPARVATPVASLPIAATAGASSGTRSAGTAGIIAGVPRFGPPDAAADRVRADDLPVGVPTPTEPVPIPAPGSAPPVDEDLDETRLGGNAPAVQPSGGASPRVATYRLAFDTGELVEVRGSGVVGRDPAPKQGETATHRVCVPDPGRSVSKTHLGFGLDAVGLWVADLGSTNGSVAVGPDGLRAPLEAGRRAHVVRGTVMEIGDRSFRVEQS